ncbi:acyltransferase family protein [Aeromicrobium sp. Root344]|uniref:acyltransferase family protein n=1 Tax=Aeromicrobium sp. Root344 TaxID=1736521 RepID=UPI000A49F3B8|nr:acyltransferase family protein [Aeromicrobium sp. Root344]
MPRTRDRRLDLLKGLLIAGVVLGHFLETSGGQAPGVLYSGWHHDPQRWILTFLYLFHMPLFVFLAGITARPRHLAHRIAEMVGLYVLLQTTYVVLRFGVGDLSAERLLHPTYALWFLLAMAWWLVALPFVVRLGAYALPAATAVAVVAVLLPYPDGDLVSWSRALCYLPFFVAGHLYGSGALRRTAETSSAAMATAAATLVTVTAVVVRSGLDPRWIRGADTAASMGVTGVDAVTHRVLCLALAALCGACVLVIVPSRLRQLEGLGRRSLAVYALHIPVVFVLQDTFQGAGVGQVEASLLATAVTVVVLRVLVHPFFDRAVRRTASTMAQVAVPPPLVHDARELEPVRA